MERTKELFFTKNTYVSTGHPPAISLLGSYFKGAKVISAIGGAVTLCLLPSSEELDSILIYLTAVDAYYLGELLMERAEVTSRELLSLELERR